MPEEFSFKSFENKPVQTMSSKQENQPNAKSKINFQQLPEDSEAILSSESENKLAEKYLKEEIIPVPPEQTLSNSYLSLVLAPNLRDLEMMIRGLEYVKRFNPILQRDEVILRKIEGHPLNEYGVNRIMAELKVYCSPEIKLGRKREKDYYNSVSHVCHSVVRLIYKNLKKFGMDTQVKQRNAKTLCNAIIEFIDASYSRSVMGKENDLSRATELKIEGSINPTDLYQNFSKEKKEALKN